jgi:hypothetical protein
MSEKLSMSEKLFKELEKDIHALAKQALVLDKKYVKKFNYILSEDKNSEQKVGDLLARLATIYMVDPLSKFSYTNITTEYSRDLDTIKDKTGKVIEIKPNDKQSCCIKLWSGMKKYKSLGKKFKS